MSENLPLGIRNNNPGNLRFIAKNPFLGQIGENKGFGVYETMLLGVRASAKQIKKHIRNGANTIELLITKWAPSSENDTDAYIMAVAEETSFSIDEVLDADNIHTITDLCYAIFFHENGMRIDNHTLESGVALAFEGN